MTKTKILLPLLITAFLVVSPSASASAFKCKQANGKVTISNTPCSENEQTVKIQSAEYINPAHRQAAIEDLNRQKGFVAQREQERVVETSSYSSSSNDRSAKSLSSVDQCIMRVSSQTRLAPKEEAHQKVRCFEGTRGMSEKCEYTVAGIMMLPKNTEAHYRQQCRLVSAN